MEQNTNRLRKTFVEDLEVEETLSVMDYMFLFCLFALGTMGMILFSFLISFMMSIFL